RGSRVGNAGLGRADAKPLGHGIRLLTRFHVDLVDVADLEQRAPGITAGVTGWDALARPVGTGNIEARPARGGSKHVALDAAVAGASLVRLRCWLVVSERQ